jgi:hypothetical protein
MSLFEWEMLAFFFCGAWVYSFIRARFWKHRAQVLEKDIEYWFNRINQEKK